MILPFKNFRFQCISRILLISGSITLLIYVIPRTKFLATPILIGLLIIYQIGNLIHYVEKTNRDLTHLLNAIKYSDFSQSFTNYIQGSTFQELNRAFNEVMEMFRKTRSEKEVHYRYLQTVLHHIGVGLIVFKQDGQIELINNAAKRLLKIHRLKNINEIMKTSQPLCKAFQRMKNGERNLIRYLDPDTEELVPIAMHGTQFILKTESYTLVSLQSIQTELEEKEMEAWQNLIRVLTHEIMNSITPITSLASTAKGLISNKIHKTEKLNKETLVDVHKAVDTIEKRGEGLLKFVDNYRKLTRIPKPDFQIITIQELFTRVHTLMENELKDGNILFKTSINPPELQITVDTTLIEQVLINLVKNSLQALQKQEKGEIHLTAQIDGKGKTIIQIIESS